jgi:hypothetical protein
MGEVQYCSIFEGNDFFEKKRSDLSVFAEALLRQGEAPTSFNKNEGLPWQIPTKLSCLVKYPRAALQF